MERYKNMMNLRRLASVAFTTSLLCLVSCTWDFDDINSDPNKVKVEDFDKDGQWASYIKSMQQTIFPEDDNTYQRMDELHGNIYSGYHGEASYWNGNNSSTYVFGPSPAWNDDGFKAVYGATNKPKYPVPGIMNSWNTMRKRMDPTSVVLAIANVVKVAGMHRATDMYGPLPYTKYGDSFYAEYDSQETIYKAFFTELDHAITIMTAFNTSSPGARPIANYDMFFGSDMVKWIKFANSLKLRLAIRIRYVEPALAMQYANEAVGHPIGVIEDNGGNVMIQSNSIYDYKNPLTMLWEGYAESRMGASMESYMKLNSGGTVMTIRAYQNILHPSPVPPVLT